MVLFYLCFFLYTRSKVITLFQVRNTFSPVHQNHYIFTPRDLTRWCLGFLRYDLKEDEQSVNLVLEVSVLTCLLTHSTYTLIISHAFCTQMMLIF
jgi:hypothetical protein